MKKHLLIPTVAFILTVAFVSTATFSSAQAIVGGGNHSLAVCSDTTVWAWGANGNGQLGDNTISGKTSPIQVHGTGNVGFLKDIIALGGGEMNSLALKYDGTMWAWGLNGNGQLGDGTTSNKYTPVQVSGLTGIVSIAGGQFHSLALKNDNTVMAWGLNTAGQLGDGTTIQKTTAVQVSGLTGITAIAGGQWHSLALKNNGTAWAWGLNTNGQLGDGTNTNKTTPVQVSGLTGVTAIATGLGNLSLALKNDSTVWAWGRNNYGQLGDGTTIDKNIPVQVSGLSGITAIAHGNVHSVALKNDGTVWTWGRNNNGQLGDGTTIDKNIPVQVSGLSGIIAITAGYFHCLALKNDGTVWAWGSNLNGQIGDGTTTDKTTPVQVSSLCNVVPTFVAENNMAINVSIFPNPFSTQTVLQTDVLLSNATLTVDNCFGQTVAQIKNISRQTITFNRDNLPSGLYFVRLTQDNKVIAVDKLVIADR